MELASDGFSLESAFDVAVSDAISAHRQDLTRLQVEIVSLKEQLAAKCGREVAPAKGLGDHAVQEAPCPPEESPRHFVRNTDKTDALLATCGPGDSAEQASPCPPSPKSQMKPPAPAQTFKHAGQHGNSLMTNEQDPGPLYNSHVSEEAFYSPDPSSSKDAAALPGMISGGALPEMISVMPGGAQPEMSSVGSLHEVPQMEEIEEGPVPAWKRFVLGILELNLESLNNRELRDAWWQSDDFLQKVQKNHNYVNLWKRVETERDNKLGKGKRRAVVMHQQSKSVSGDEASGFDSRFSLSPSGSKTSCGGELECDDFFLEAIDSVFVAMRQHMFWRYVEMHYVMNPEDPKHTCWAVSSILMIGYDFIMLPMSAYDMPENVFFVFMAWFSQVFWTVDMGFSFLTGITIKGEPVKRLRYIARQYLTSWFSFDVIVVLPLWFVLFLGSEGSMGDTRLIFKYFRMLRFLRLLRLAKVEHVLNSVLASVNSQDLVLIFGVVKLMTCLILLSHVNSCIWFAIGSTKHGWVAAYDNLPISHKYMLSMHWSLTQFQGSTDILPITESERSYAVLSLLLALLVLASFVSSLTNKLLQLQSLHDTKNYQQEAVRGYLSSHNISADLSSRVKKFVEWNQTHQKQHEYKDEVMKLLPLQLLMDLRFETRAPVLAYHDYFEVFCIVYPRLTRTLCQKTMEHINPAPDQMVFTFGETCPCMYFLMVGTCIYSYETKVQQQLKEGADSTRVGRDFLGRREMTEEAYFAEACLWMHWEHKGTLAVGKFASLLTVSSQGFGAIVSQHPPAHVSCILYARQYLEGLLRVDLVNDIVKAVDLMTASTMHRSASNVADIVRDTTFTGTEVTKHSSEKSDMSRQSSE